MSATEMDAFKQLLDAKFSPNAAIMAEAVAANVRGGFLTQRRKGVKAEDRINMMNRMGKSYLSFCQTSLHGNRHLLPLMRMVGQSCCSAGFGGAAAPPYQLKAVSIRRDRRE